MGRRWTQAIQFLKPRHQNKLGEILGLGKTLSELVVKPIERALWGDLGTSPITEREDVFKPDGLKDSQPKGSIENQRGRKSIPRAEEGTKDEGIECTPRGVMGGVLFKIF